jgi:hypothetical protein
LRRAAQTPRTAQQATPASAALRMHRAGVVREPPLLPPFLTGALEVLLCGFGVVVTQVAAARRRRNAAYREV